MCQSDAVFIVKFCRHTFIFQKTMLVNKWLVHILNLWPGIHVSVSTYCQSCIIFELFWFLLIGNDVMQISNFCWRWAKITVSVPLIQLHRCINIDFVDLLSNGLHFFIFLRMIISVTLKWYFLYISCILL
jgi:hypothetical protein